MLDWRTETMRRLNRFVAAAACLSCVFMVPMRAKQAEPPAIVSTPAPMDVLYAMPGDLNYSYGPKGEELARILSGDRPQTATIIVTYNGFSPEAQAAFQAAVNIWQLTISSRVPIRIQANWTTLGEG